MNYTIEVNEPFGSERNWFHSLIIDEPKLTADDAEVMWLELEHNSNVVICYPPDYPGCVVYGDTIDYTHVMFYARRDMRADFPAMIERTVGDGREE